MTAVAAVLIGEFEMAQPLSAPTCQDEGQDARCYTHASERLRHEFQVMQKTIQRTNCSNGLQPLAGVLGHRPRFRGCVASRLGKGGAVLVGQGRGPSGGVRPALAPAAVDGSEEPT
jgi:hypothetical protein